MSRKIITADTVGGPRIAAFHGFARLVFAPSPDPTESELDQSFDHPDARARAAGSDGEIVPELDEADLKNREAGELLAHARSLVAEAAVRADEILAEARRQSETIEADAYQAGFAQGEEAGHLLGAQKVEPVVRNLAAVADNLGRQRDALLAESEAHLVGIAHLVARKIIQRELRQDPTTVLDVVRGALRRIQHASRLVLHVSPHDFQFIEPHTDQFHAQIGPGRQVAIEADPQITRGGCRIVADTGVVDATLETTFESIEYEIGDPATPSDGAVAPRPQE